MACETCRAPEAPDGAARKPGGAAPTKSFLGKRKSSTSLAPGLLAAQLQSRCVWRGWVDVWVWVDVALVISVQSTAPHAPLMPHALPAPLIPCRAAGS